MKKKLRKIIVEESSYLWLLIKDYDELEATMGPNVSTVLRVFREGMKNTPLIVHFLTPNRPIKGHTRITSNEFGLNINRPAYVQILIEGGLAKGWDPESKGLEINDGIQLLEACGIDVSNI